MMLAILNILTEKALSCSPKNTWYNPFALSEEKTFKHAISPVTRLCYVEK